MRRRKGGKWTSRKRAQTRGSVMRLKALITLFWTCNFIEGLREDSSSDSSYVLRCDNFNHSVQRSQGCAGFDPFRSQREALLTMTYIRATKWSWLLHKADQSFIQSAGPKVFCSITGSYSLNSAFSGKSWWFPKRRSLVSFNQSCYRRSFGISLDIELATAQKLTLLLKVQAFLSLPYRRNLFSNGPCGDNWRIW